MAKIEKNLTDHTEFLNYKKEMDKWLANANETLENCAGIGNEPETRQKLTAVTVNTRDAIYNFSESYFIHSFKLTFPFISFDLLSF